MEDFYGFPMPKEETPDNIFYVDDEYCVYWICDDSGQNVWFEIDSKEATLDVKDAAYNVALAAIGRRFLQHSMDEDVYTDLTRK